MKSKKIDAVILAGGKGTRIKKYLKLLPKPMMSINGRNFLSYLIQRLSIYNIRKIYILCGYRADPIIKKYHNKIINFVPIVCIKEKKPMGTGGCLHKISKKISKQFIWIRVGQYLILFFADRFWGRWSNRLDLKFDPNHTNDQWKKGYNENIVCFFGTFYLSL